MIDSRELQEIRDRSTAYGKAVELMLIAAEGGMFAADRKAAADAVLPAAIDSARDVPRLLDAVERLAPAEYWLGREECMEGECDWFFDGDGNQIRPLGEPCEHIEVKVATLADVKRAEYLDELAQELRKAVEAHQRGEEWVAGRTLAELVLEGVNDAYARIYCDEDANPVVAAAGLVGAETAVTRHDRDPDHGVGDA